ncbi:phospholipase D2-like isoform X2 [Varroa destructor]|uniref:Phospholipase n=1 Tax=Varroa destructor TaxID=109461 RepID=A0A7M7L2D2_VARDE|nr:phospholipase D2-like isoform X2 [Varroa destructor]
MDDHSIASNDMDPTKTEDKEFSELETSYDDDDGNDEAGRPESERDNRVPRLSRVVTAAEVGNGVGLNQPSNVPFTRLYEPPISLAEASEYFYIPGVPVIVSCCKLEGDSIATSMIQSHVYGYELVHGDFKWTIRKRYKHFIDLHAALKLYRATMAVPLPSRSHQRRRRSFVEGTANKRLLPRISKIPDTMLAADQVSKRHKELATYLRGLLSIPAYRNHPKTVEFLEISPYSFLKSTGAKGKESLVSKRAGGHKPHSCLLHFHMLWFNCMTRWRRRWLIARDTYVLSLHPVTGAIRAVLLMDKDFTLESGLLSGLQMTNSQRSLCIDVWTRREKREWSDHIHRMKETTAKGFVERNALNSFAPVRKQTYTRWYVDGAMYMKAVANALENAETEIFITDWWLTPEIYLKRPPGDSPYWRLDEILKRKAESGVHVFIMLYKEVKSALNINSFYSKRKITGLHKNIRVFRHPDHMKEGVLLWAHHEKLVIVDQKFAFFGGIDLCYGRWDDALHRLTDTAPTETFKITRTLPETRSQSSEDQGNVKHSAVNDVTNRSLQKRQSDQTAKYDNTQIRPSIYFDQETWKIINPDAGDHLTNGRMKLLQAKRRLSALIVFQNVRRETYRRSLGDLVDCVSHTNTEFIPDEEKLASFVNEDARFWLGKDYTNFIFKDVTNMHQPFAEHIDRTRTPRMPWHDIGGLVIGRAARDLARHFIQRWNFVKNNKAKRNDFYPWLLPMSYDVAEEFDVGKCEEWFGKLYRCEVQALRSASSWSVGIREREHSIEDAYVELIKNAKYYIYIENQFFISMKPGGMVYNRVADTLYERILKAYCANEKFRVYIVLPLLPAFEGEVGTPSGASIQAITHWNYASLCRGPNSLLARLEQKMENPRDYVAFFGLRKHDILNGIPVTELVYVHSKLMIVDDSQVIMGSANINDRSLLGTRDSEIAALLRDQHFYSASFDGQPVKVGAYATSLRQWIFREHLGGFTKVDDPVSDDFFNNTWKRIAKNNTRIFEHVFRPLPTDSVATFAELRNYLNQPSLVKKDPKAAIEELKKIAGHLVELPEKFLVNQSLTPAPGTKEHLLPMALWT